MSLRTLLAAGALALALPALAFAQGPAPAQPAQQERMKTCNAEAGTRKLAGDPRKEFMSACLAGNMPAAPAAANQPSAAQAAQQERMKTCNAEAGTRKLA